METDEMYMSRCLQLAACGIYGARPNPMVGAVIVAPGGRIIGEGYHAKCGEGHAEVNAFASVRAADEKLLPQSTLYVSLEPCSHYGKTPPCADLVVSKGVARVVVGCVDPFAKVHGAGIKKLREAGIQVTVGVMEEECRELNRRFFTFQTLHRPYIILKWAQSVDGFIDRDFKPTMISTPFTQIGRSARPSSWAASPPSATARASTCAAGAAPRRAASCSAAAKGRPSTGFSTPAARTACSRSSWRAGPRRTAASSPGSCGTR